MHDQFITPGFRRGLDVFLPSHFIEILHELSGPEIRVLLCIFPTDPYWPEPVQVWQIAEVLHEPIDQVAEVLCYLFDAGWIKGDCAKGYKIRWQIPAQGLGIYTDPEDKPPAYEPPPGLKGLRTEYMRLRRKLLPTVFSRDNHACQDCGATEKLTIDHIIPLFHGGSNDLANLRTLCLTCNCRKGSKMEAASA